MPARALSISVRRVVSGVAAVSVVLTVAGCSGATPDDEGSIVRTTTAVAGAGVVGLGRDTATACPTVTPPDSPDRDPQRIVVLSTQALDTACALGVWERVVGAATVDGPTPQPKFLGSGISKIPSIGTVGAPDVDEIAALKPDLILGTTAPSTDVVAKLQAVAPTTFDDLFDGWQERFVAGGEALGRRDAAQRAIDDYRQRARDTGAQIAAGQTEASVVRFTADGATLLGNDTFAGKVLADAGVRRPSTQRGGSTDLDTADPTAADGDVIYVVFDGDAGKAHGTEVMSTDAWEKLGAANDKRQFTPDDAIWSGTGLTAANALLDDLRASLNGYTS